jgi:hyperosmotically inducible protein
MKYPLASTCIALAVLLGPLGALAADVVNPDPTPSGTFIKDSAITTEIKSKLAADHLMSLGQIHVDTDKDGVVWLSGTARTQEASDHAESLARGTEHVTAVHNDIHIRKED